MKWLLNLLFICLALLYLLSPYDIVPDIFPVTGWIDDSVIILLLYYWFRRNTLKNDASKKRRTEEQDQRFKAEGENQNQQAKEPEFKSPYEILGVSPSATLKEIKEAYRSAAQAYHPDKVAHLGPELRNLAQKKFIEIQKAYEELAAKVK